MNDTVMSRPGNPLLVVNGRVDLNAPLPVRRDQEHLSNTTPVVDANHMVASGRVGAGPL